MKRDREKRYLKQIREIDSDILDLQADANVWRERAKSTGNQQTGERVQTSGTKDSMRPVDIYMDIEREIDALYEKRNEIIGVIRSLPAPEKGVLFKKYVLGMDYYEIVEAIPGEKSYSWATSVHGRGLQMVKKILDKREELWEDENV